MQKRRLGYSDLYITPIGLGTWALGGGGWRGGWGPQNDGDSIATIHRALELGRDVFTEIVVNCILAGSNFNVTNNRRHCALTLGRSSGAMCIFAVNADATGLAWSKKSRQCKRLS